MKLKGLKSPMRALLILLSAWTPSILVARAKDLPRDFVDSAQQSYRLIDAAHFEMGSNRWEEFRHDHSGLNELDNRTVHPVIITTPFYMATTEVTVEQFRKFVDATEYVTTAEQESGIVGWKPQDDDRGNIEVSFQQDKTFSWRSPGFDQEDSHPVVGVSYHDAKAYCRWLNRLKEQDDAVYRLPTEAEWELACRAGTDTHFSFGNEYRGVIHQQANVGNVELEKAFPQRVMNQWLVNVKADTGDAHVFTAPVGSYPANAFGLHDLHGNVWEWCEDLYLDTFYEQFTRKRPGELRRRAIDPLCQDRWNEHGQWQVMRGGAWFLAPHGCRSATRGVFEANDAACYLGFRVVREVPAESAARYEKRHAASEAALEALRPTLRKLAEYNDGQLQLEMTAEELDDAMIEHLHALEYSVELMIRPPGRMTSKLLEKLFPVDASSGGIKRLVGFTLATTCEDLHDRSFEFLRNYSELERLQITGSGDLTDEHLFPHLNQSSQLTSLSLQGDGISDDGLATLPALRHLETLQIHATGCRGESLPHFAGSPLQNVSFAELTDKGAAALAEFPTLRFVNVNRCPISRAGLESLVSLPILETLNLYGCEQLAAEEFSLLASARMLRTIQFPKSAGDVAVEALANAHRLQEMNIGGQLTDAGLRGIGDIVSLR